MPRPLCLDGRRTALSVELAGRALLTHAEGSADQLVPLARIDRILCWGEVAWTSSALRAVAAAGPDVLFLSGRDEVAAILSPPRARSADFSAVIEAAFAHPAWEGRFADWQAHVASVLFRDAAKRTPGYPHPPPWRYRDPVALAAWNRLLRPALPVLGPTATRRSFMAHLVSWIRARLGNSGISRAWLGGSSVRPDLTGCFAAAFEWATMPATVCFAQTLSRAGVAGRSRPLPASIAEAFAAEEAALLPRFDRAFTKFRVMASDLAEGAA
jgi:CRISPR associated protein Cas1